MSRVEYITKEIVQYDNMIGSPYSCGDGSRLLLVGSLAETDEKSETRFMLIAMPTEALLLQGQTPFRICNARVTDSGHIGLHLYKSEHEHVLAVLRPDGKTTFSWEFESLHLFDLFPGGRHVCWYDDGVLSCYDIERNELAFSFELTDDIDPAAFSFDYDKQILIIKDSAGGSRRFQWDWERHKPKRGIARRRPPDLNSLRRSRRTGRHS